MHDKTPSSTTRVARVWRSTDLKNSLRYLLIVATAIVLFSCGSSDQPDVIPSGWPDFVSFRGPTESLNSQYYALVRDGCIWIKPNTERTGNDGPWEKLSNLPEGLDGQVTEISMDDEHIIALNHERQIYTMWSALDAPETFRWQKEWGLPFWHGPGMKLRQDLVNWNFSVVSPREDGFYTDPAGNLFPIGFAKCSHIIMLNSGGQTITFDDPWLPCDYSYEIGTPYRGRFISVGLSSSGSTHFIINRFGDMFTRTFDFDLSGLDDLFLKYSYEDQHGSMRPAIQLPAEPWQKQPKIATQGKALITDRISIAKIGKNCIHRLLRVEGKDSRGSTGYYEKDLQEPDSLAWVFHATNEVLHGRGIENKPYDSATETLGESEDRPYAMQGGLAGVSAQQGFSAEIPDFNCYNSPSQLMIRLADGNDIPLVLHYRDTVRVLPRERGIDQNPRRFSGAIEVPMDLIEHLSTLPQSVSDFVHTYLEIGDGRRFTDVRLVVTLEDLTMKGGAVWWTFHHVSP